MKKVEIVKGNTVKVKPFIFSDFIQDEVSDVTIENIKKVTKKELKNLAEHLGLSYDDTHIVFAKKLLNAYLTGKR